MQVCSFIGEKYEAQMLSTAQSAADVTTGKETWKRKAYQTVDNSRTQVWKRELTLEQNRQAEALIGDRLITYGYNCSEHFDRSAKVYPSITLLAGYRGAMESFVAAGVRFWQGANGDKHHIQIYVGEPDKDKWLRNQKPERWWDTLQITIQVLNGMLVHQQIFWVREKVVNGKLGICGGLLARLFQITAEVQVV
jgi:hypothetical protein